jgi:hypothetical protein
MRIALLVVAALALVGFLMVAVVLPQRAGAESKEAGHALVAGAEPAKLQVGAAAEKAGNLAGSGKEVIVAENGEIRGWNEKNALEIALTPSLSAGKVSWNCKGYPVNAMPISCGGR